MGNFVIDTNPNFLPNVQRLPMFNDLHKKLRQIAIVNNEITSYLFQSMFC